ncbi:hypothetical protein, partial [Streptomyces albidoflavus]|uniref:hypothetical protein n=1 Tax=Streptomyces albidoflavus TaxID=1886 RepID=UPI0033E2462D
AASPDHVARVRAAFPHLTLINGYGPVESMVFVQDHNRVLKADVTPDPEFANSVRSWSGAFSASARPSRDQPPRLDQLALSPSGR